MDIFDNSQYTKNSQTQKRQGELLLKLCEEFSPDKVVNVLDIGCGAGKISKKVDNMYKEADVIGIDSSEEQVKKASENYEHIDFYNLNFPTSKFKKNKFDLIISNCAMHWIDKQREAYEELSRIISEEGRIIIHQGHEGCYSEMKNLAINILNEMGNKKVCNWEYPINYHTEESIKNLVESCGLSLELIRVIESDLPDTIFTDYANAGLLNFEEIVEEDWEIFKEKFLERSNREIDVDDINSKRLYFVCKQK